MVEIASDRPLFKTILVEMAYSVIDLHNWVNKSRITILLLCPEELELGKHLRCLPKCDHRKLLAVVVIIIVRGQQWWLELLDDSLCNVIVDGHVGNCLLVRIVEKVADFHGVAIVELTNLLFQFSDQFSGGFNFLGGDCIWAELTVLETVFDGRWLDILLPSCDGVLDAVKEVDLLRVCDAAFNPWQQLVVESTTVIGLECANDSNVARLNFRSGVWRQVEQCCVPQLNVEFL